MANGSPGVPEGRLAHLRCGVCCPRSLAALPAAIMEQYSSEGTCVSASMLTGRASRSARLRLDSSPQSDASALRSARQRATPRMGSLPEHDASTSRSVRLLGALRCGASASRSVHLIGSLRRGAVTNSCAEVLLPLPERVPTHAKRERKDKPELCFSKCWLALWESLRLIL